MSKAERRARADAVCTLTDLALFETLILQHSFRQKQLGLAPGERPFHDGIPSAYIIKLHLKWLAMSGTGVLEDKITDVRVVNCLNCLKRAIRLHTNYVNVKAENDQFISYIRKDLVSPEHLA
jgi:hypothetical protein